MNSYLRSWHHFIISLEKPGLEEELIRGATTIKIKSSQLQLD